MKIINEAIPTVMFHSLAYTATDPFYLSISADTFEKFIIILQKSRYNFVTIEQIVNGNVDLSEKNVCFTFDDGFEDNYSILFPILKKHGVPCTIFISSDFVADSKKDNSIQSRDSSWIRTFLSKKQIIEMHRSGLVDFQGHSKTHTWYPVSGEVLAHHDISHIERYYWIYWNAFPGKKPYGLDPKDLTEFREFGVFRYERSLAARRFLPDLGEFNATGNDVVHGRMETDKEMLQRFENEIVTDKRNTERLLQKNLCFFCWPGGEMCAESYAVFRRSGYKSCSVPSNPIKKLHSEKIYDVEQPVVRRISPSHIWKHYDLGADYFLHNIRQFGRSGLRYWLHQKVAPRLIRIKKRTC